MQNQPAAFRPAPRPLAAVARTVEFAGRPPLPRPPLLLGPAPAAPARAAPHAMSYRDRSRSRSRSRERGRDREDRGGERVSVLVRNLPLDAR